MCNFNKLEKFLKKRVAILYIDQMNLNGTLMLGAFYQGLKFFLQFVKLLHPNQTSRVYCSFQFPKKLH